jgi:hypothetical protein
VSADTEQLKRAIQSLSILDQIEGPEWRIDRDDIRTAIGCLTCIIRRREMAAEETQPKS